MPNRLSTDEMSVDLEAALRFSNGVSQAPPVNKLTAREMESLIAISDTFLPSIQLNSANYSTSLQTFFSTSASMLGTPEVVSIYLSIWLHASVHEYLINVCMYMIGDCFNVSRLECIYLGSCSM